MIKRIFYSDKKLREKELLFRWNETVDYLKELFEEHKHTPVGEEILCHLIFQCWYAFAYLIDTQARYIISQEIDFYKENWKSAVAKGIDLYYDSPSVCWIIGFTSFTGNKFFKPFKKFGEDMMKRGVDLSTPEMPFDVLSGKSRKDKNDYYYIIPSELFPSYCDADKFFYDKLIKLGFNG